MIFDCIVIGTGYAGCTASIYLSMAQKKHILFSGPIPGGLISTTSIVANYPGLNGITGSKMSQVMIDHAVSFSDCTLVYDIVNSIEKCEEGFLLYTENGDSYQSRSVILATGSSHKKLAIEDINGVMYCAVCDGFFFKDKIVSVVGGGNSAFESACYLAQIAKKVILIHRGTSYKAFPMLVQKAQQYENIHCITNSEIEQYLQDDGRFVGVTLKNGEKIDCDGVFINIGHYPNTKFLSNFVLLDKEGYVVVDQNLESSEKNIFAAGDLINNPWRQGVVAAGDGCKAALSAIRSLE
jgi:thioredoxin reductase (NADPH)